MKQRIGQIVKAALIAAAYVALTYISSTFGLAYGSIQFRLSEGLMILAAFVPEATFGLTLGCLISNVIGPFGILDMAVGGLATLVAAALIRFVCTKIKSTALSVLIATVFSALINGLLVGFEITYMSVKEMSLSIFTLTFFTVFLGEAVVIAILGPLIALAINKNPVLNRYFLKGAKRRV